MNDKGQEMKLEPIGFVRNEIEGPGKRNWQEVISEIVIKPELNESLDQITGFSHLIVLFWTQKVAAADIPAKVHPQHNLNLPLVGLFASRSPIRPNPVCLTVVRLLERRDNILVVKGLDAFNSTVVIDIKPYIPRSDLIRDAAAPDWCGKLK
jgi:tRNA-Thr(GGU) m(6)t(6)A37 methyltransferase TsaA